MHRASLVDHDTALGISEGAAFQAMIISLDHRLADFNSVGFDRKRTPIRRLCVCWTGPKPRQGYRKGEGRPSG